jgi:hypothetical protein
MPCEINRLFHRGDPCVLCERYIESYALDAINWYNPDKEHKAIKTPLPWYV